MTFCSFSFSEADVTPPWNRDGEVAPPLLSDSHVSPPSVSILHSARNSMIERLLHLSAMDPTQISSSTSSGPSAPDASARTVTSGVTLPTPVVPAEPADGIEEVSYGSDCSHVQLKVKHGVTGRSRWDESSYFTNPAWQSINFFPQISSSVMWRSIMYGNQASARRKM